jgi:hypothetical protein
MRDYGDREDLKVRFQLPVKEGEVYLHRTHPIVEGLAGYVLDTALDPILARKAVARRAGVIRTAAVTARTTVLLLRLRFHILTSRKGRDEQALLAEDCALVAFRGTASTPEWLGPEDAEALLAAAPDTNVLPEQARHFVSRALDDLDALRPAFERIAHERAGEILAAHERVTNAVKAKAGEQRVDPKLPVDVLGLYVYLPVGN